MSNGPPWKLALIGLVAVVGALALLSVDWSTDELAAFVAMLLVARGALHLVTMSFTGLEGAFSALTACGEIAVGIMTLAWPSPTLLVLVLIVGIWVLVHAIVDATVVLATRNDRPHWVPHFAAAIAEIALGVALIARAGGTLRAAAVTIGLIAMLEGALDISIAIGRQRGRRSPREAVRVGTLASAS